MKVAVTGASGYLGRSFLSMYKGTYDLIALTRDAASVNKVDGVDYRECDYSIDSLKKILAGCDAVVHLAYAMATKSNEKEGLSAYASSLEATENLLSAAHELKIDNIVFASSRLVYPNYTEKAFKEEDKPNPSNHYGKSKLMAEELCAKHSDEYGMKIKVLRFGQIIGPDMKVKGLFSTFVENALVGKPLTLIGRNVRDYIYVYDACTAIDCALRATDSSGIYNISIGRGIDNREMAEEIIAATGSRSTIVTSGEDDAQKTVDRVVLDCSKAREEFGFACSYDRISEMVNNIMNRQKSSGKTILILGAGNAQIDAIELCKSKGWLVAGCSYTNTDAGIPLLDKFKQTDIKDVDGVARFAEEISADAIYSVGSDLAIPTAMRTSEILGLPHFISYDSAMRSHSKHLMREALGKDFEGNVEYIVCTDLADAKEYDAFPAMMKPVDSQGQRGCYRVDSFEDIEEHFDTSKDYSVTGKVIIESFIDGNEISVNSYRVDNKTVFALVSDREVFDEYPGGLVKKHRVPSTFADEDVQNKAIRIVDKAAERLGITDGPCYCQMKIGSDGKPYIIEIAPRLDGCHMWNLIKHYTGIDLLSACFNHLLNGDPEIGEPSIDKDAVYELEFLSEKTGESFDLAKYDLSNSEYTNCYYETGDKVSKVNGYFEKCGYVIKRVK